MFAKEISKDDHSLMLDIIEIWQLLAGLNKSLSYLLFFQYIVKYKKYPDPYLHLPPFSHMFVPLSGSQYGPYWHSFPKNPSKQSHLYSE